MHIRFTLICNFSRIETCPHLLNQLGFLNPPFQDMKGVLFFCHIWKSSNCKRKMHDFCFKMGGGNMPVVPPLPLVIYISPQLSYLSCLKVALFLNYLIYLVLGPGRKYVLLVWRTRSSGWRRCAVSTSWFMLTSWRTLSPFTKTKVGPPPFKLLTVAQYFNSFSWIFKC